jgi:hypothetical protein
MISPWSKVIFTDSTESLKPMRDRERILTGLTRSSGLRRQSRSRELDLSSLRHVHPVHPVKTASVHHDDHGLPDALN